MGKPFDKELQLLNDTFEWAQNVDISDAGDLIGECMQHPLIVVGSGGSLSTCNLFAFLHQRKGQICKVLTPLEMFHHKAILNSANLILVSSSGKNTDILFAQNLAIKHEPNRIISFCLTKRSKLSENSKLYTNCKVIDYEIPCGKDGFLATNSLIGYFTLLGRFYNTQLGVPKLELSKEDGNRIYNFVASLPDYFSIIVLYGGWSQPVAIDIESKFIEAGLGNVSLADYRNFAHGRHNWLDKQGKVSSVIALYDSEDQMLAEKTLSLIPASIPKLILATSYNETGGCLDLLLKAFYLVLEVGKKVKIDPGRPGVPDYGRELYHLKYSSYYIKKKEPSLENIQIARRTGLLGEKKMESDYFHIWKKHLSLFKLRINAQEFGALVLDYDGTLCSTEQRFDPLKIEIQQRVLSLLEQEITIGIATGRGKSVREELQRFVPQKLWSNVLIGYYNCSQIALLADNSLPKKKPIAEVLVEVQRCLENISLLKDVLNIEQKREQLEIHINDKTKSIIAKRMIRDLLMPRFNQTIKILESSHSIDIIVISVSKTTLILACAQEATKNNKSEAVLCIGDKGKFPGNDYELLASEYSLSVDESSTDPSSGWNLAGLGMRNVDATLHYFDRIKITENKNFKITF